MMSDKSANSKYCHEELTKARYFGKYIIPIRLTDQVTVPENLSWLNEITGVDMFELDMKSLTDLDAAIKDSAHTRGAGQFSQIQADDKHLLKHCWQFINSHYMEELREQIIAWRIDGPTYKEHILGYLEMRQVLEKHFAESFLEDCFKKFDAPLAELVELVGDTFRPPYDIIYPASRGFSAARKARAKELRIRYSIQANREMVLPKLKEVMKAHHELVHYIKVIDPHFKFDKD